MTRTKSVLVCMLLLTMLLSPVYSQNVQRQIQDLRRQNLALQNEVKVLKAMTQALQRRLNSIEKMMGWASFRITNIWLEGHNRVRRRNFAVQEKVWLNVSWEALKRKNIPLRFQLNVSGPGRVQAMQRDLGMLSKGNLRTELVFLDRQIGHYYGEIVLAAGREVRKSWFDFHFIKVPYVPGFVYSGKNAKGLREYTHEMTGMVFVLIPAGQFTMGPTKKVPAHPVFLDPYLIAKYEVTQQVWQRVMGNNPAKFRSPRLPVEKISWEDARNFCRKTGLQLPTEAQWEKACRAGNSTIYFWGQRMDGRYCWYEANSQNSTHPVGTTLPNAYGLYDMSGNVWEWCRDWYQEKLPVNPRPRNPQGPARGIGKVYRGGSWFNQAALCSCSFRSYYRPQYRSSNLGFRPVKEIR